jgi:hypothetical protein
MIALSDCLLQPLQDRGVTARIAIEIESLLECSRRNNAANDITGALLFDGRAFAQVLEGPRSSVEAVYAKIVNDPRHSNVCFWRAIGSLSGDF